MFIPDLEAAGFTTELAFLLDEHDDRLLYQPGKATAKAKLGLKCYRKRRADVRKLDKADLVVVFREALMTRSIFFEKEVARRGIPMVMDFDDAIWIRDMSSANKLFSPFKDPDKLGRILPLCTAVTAGNEYLASYARNYCDRVHVLPSTVDTAALHPTEIGEGQVTIGWSGSLTTLPHFDALVPVLRRLRETYGNKIRLLTIGAQSSAADELSIDFEPWSSAAENTLLNQLDIGLMPLPDSPWTQGKCGMKLLLYMATGKAAVASPVGVNEAILAEGRGLLAGDEDTWFQAISKLIENAQLRRDMGMKSRAFIEAEYSRQRWAPNYVDIYSSCILQKPGGKVDAVKGKGISLQDQN